MQIPDEIYLSNDDDGNVSDEIEVTWSSNRINESDIKVKINPPTEEDCIVQVKKSKTVYEHYFCKYFDTFSQRCKIFGNAGETRPQECIDAQKEYLKELKSAFISGSNITFESVDSEVKE